MDKAERTKMVKAMEYIARQVNDENVFYGLAALAKAVEREREKKKAASEAAWEVTLCRR